MCWSCRVPVAIFCGICRISELFCKLLCLLSWCPIIFVICGSLATFLELSNVDVAFAMDEVKDKSDPVFKAVINTLYPQNDLVNFTMDKNGASLFGTMKNKDIFAILFTIYSQVDGITSGSMTLAVHRFFFWGSIGTGIYAILIILYFLCNVGCCIHSIRSSHNESDIPMSNRSKNNELKMRLIDRGITVKSVDS
jgi:hypothetical protein